MLLFWGLEASAFAQTIRGDSIPLTADGGLARNHRMTLGGSTLFLKSGTRNKMDCPLRIGIYTVITLGNAFWFPIRKIIFADRSVNIS